MNQLPVLTSKLLDVVGVRHAFFTRNGGVSQGIYASLNVGIGSNDDPDAVAENRRRCAAHPKQRAKPEPVRQPRRVMPKRR